MTRSTGLRPLRPSRANIRCTSSARSKSCGSTVALSYAVNASANRSHSDSLLAENRSSRPVSGEYERPDVASSSSIDLTAGRAALVKTEVSTRNTSPYSPHFVSHSVRIFELRKGRKDVHCSAMCVGPNLALSEIVDGPPDVFRNRFSSRSSELFQPCVGCLIKTDRSCYRLYIHALHTSANRAKM